jgi:hypothetical protein
MSRIDLPTASVKLRADKLERLVILQNDCASGFPYCCTGAITVNDDLSASCECGAGLNALESKESLT